jgi:sulfur carrier protein
VIELVINGKRVELDQPTPLLSYLEKLGVNPRAVAVEHNGEIIERSAFASTTLREGDKVEIVRMVGGGSSPSPRSGERVGVRGEEAVSARPPPAAP